MAKKSDSQTFMQVVMLVFGIVRRINAKRLDKDEMERLNKRQPKQCAETGELKP
nr:MAG TPA: hypothetical protein [Caudoviricetes sp.]